MTNEKTLVLFGIVSVFQSTEIIIDYHIDTSSMEISSNCFKFFTHDLVVLVIFSFEVKKDFLVHLALILFFLPPLLREIM
jgi:uncharacterized membrane protein